MKNERLETLIGAVVCEVLMVITVIVGLNVWHGGGTIDIDALSRILPVFGNCASLVVGLTFIFAGFLALIVVSLGSALGVLEAAGRPNSRSSFLTIYAFESLPAVILVAIIMATLN